MNIVLAVLILGGIILFHELGHFIFAKLSGIEVTEFSLGMGPRLLSFVKGETRYSLKLLPFGGSCAMLGEDEDSWKNILERDGIEADCMIAGLGSYAFVQRMFAEHALQAEEIR